MRAGKAVAKDVDEYIAGFPPDVRAILEAIRATIRRVVPEAEEAIKYDIPTFVLDGNLIHFAGHAKHVGIYPAPRGVEGFKDELAAYAGGKGTLQLPLDRPIPFELIERIVRYRVAENRALAEKRRARKRKKASRTS